MLSPREDQLRAASRGVNWNPMDRNRSPRGLAAHFALPAGFTVLLLTGALAAGLGGRLPATGVLILAAAVVLGISAVAEPLVAPVLGVIGWLTVAGFSRPPYAQLRMTGPVAVARRRDHGRVRPGRGRDRPDGALAGFVVQTRDCARAWRAAREQRCGPDRDLRAAGPDHAGGPARQAAGRRDDPAGGRAAAAHRGAGRAPSRPGPRQRPAASTWWPWSRSRSSAASGPPCSPRSPPACC